MRFERPAADRQIAIRPRGSSRDPRTAVSVLIDPRVLGDESDVIVASNAEGLFTYVSPACRSLLGYTPAELIGKRMASFVHPEDVLRVLAGAAGAAAEACVRSVTARYRRKDGSYAWVDQRIARVTDADTGVFLEMQVVLRRPITWQRSPEHAPTLI